jgi:hypothetical protein
MFWMFFITFCTSSSVKIFGGLSGVPGKMKRAPDLMRGKEEKLIREIFRCEFIKLNYLSELSLSVRPRTLMLLSEPGIFLASVGAELDESIIDFFISIF